MSDKNQDLTPVHHLLKQNYASSHGGATHVSMVYPKGKFRLSRRTTENLLENLIRLTDDERATLGLAECNDGAYTPVIVDVDLKVERDLLPDDTDWESSNILYSELDVETIIEIYQSVLSDIVENCTEEHLICVLLEKDWYASTRGSTTYIKNGFHLHFPFLFLKRTSQSVHLIDRVKMRLAETTLFQNLGVDDAGDVIDKATLKNPWLMYGCSKGGDSTNAYRVSAIYDHAGDEVGFEVFDKYPLFDMDNRAIRVGNQGEKYLPRILSIKIMNRLGLIARVKDNLVAPFKHNHLPKAVPARVKKATPESIQRDLEDARQLLEMLRDERAVEYEDWMRVGFVLNNISQNSMEGFSLWNEFSKRAGSRYDEDSCIDRWEHLEVRSTPGLGTLVFLAKQDNAEMYKKFRDEKLGRKVEESLVTGGAHNDIAKMLHATHGTEFVCASVSSKTWYHFNSHTWDYIEEGTFLRAKISDANPGGVLYVYKQKIRDKEREIAEADGECKKKTPESEKKMLEKIVKNLKCSPYKNNIMRECVEVFYDKKFRELLDQNPNLVAFQNGVYDLNATWQTSDGQTRTGIFRAGLPEDYISKKLPIEFNENLTMESESVQDVLRFLEQIFPDKTVRRYFLDVYCDIFYGVNTRKVVIFWTGDGDNGKSVTQSVFEKMLGDYAIKFETSLITGKKTQTGQAGPELARAGPPVRHAVLEEPDKYEQINCGILKRLSGSDSYWARDLFETGKATREIMPMFTLTFICNDLPELKNSDQATWNRIRVIPFESTFVRPEHMDTCPVDYNEQLRQKRFPRDENFGRKIPAMVEAFAWYLLRHRSIGEFKPDPLKVKEATTSYQRHNDRTKQFIRDKIELCPPDELHRNRGVSLQVLYETFKGWYRENFNNAAMPNKPVIEEYFVKAWGFPDGRGKKWMAYRFKKTMGDDAA